MTICPHCKHLFDITQTEPAAQFAQCPACFCKLFGVWLDGEFVITSSCLPEDCSTLDELPEHLSRRVELQ